MLGTCRQCQASFDRAGGAVYCMACVRQRVRNRFAAEDRKRSGDFTMARDEGGAYICKDCGQPMQPNVTCGKRRRGPMRCSVCIRAHWVAKDILSGRQLASATVKAARIKGHIPHPAGFKCADCDRQAEVYDHRDYNEPLKVEPVCRSCNVMRGSAAPFNPYLVGLLLASLATPAKQKARA